MARAIEKLGFENLDFLANLGHSIALDRHDRVFIERGNQRYTGLLQGGDSAAIVHLLASSEIMRHSE
jgi:hypothetical protein